MVDLMNLQAMKEATTVENAVHITSIDDTPVKKKSTKNENQPLPSSCPGFLLPPNHDLLHHLDSTNHKKSI
ncbi:hypothetical protein Glove_166g208 [Diversispora epigaea]|uniref:Uncharacterized protein n=1 Tax=Diversispora epigaea TaxID=1348612 RepID=A0A397IV90_9GLOM|nr:hypothetical protein Glove_166g208 [Diversispora epigaea]